MCEPLLGLPRLDRALHAVLLLAYVGLKLGDRVGLFAFDSRPRLSSGTVSGLRAFADLQRLAARLDYSTEETNFTLGLTQLAGELEQRSHHRAVHRFLRHHQRRTDAGECRAAAEAPLVLFVVFRDEELESRCASEEPRDRPGCHPRRHRRRCCCASATVVMARLRQMGVEHCRCAGGRDERRR